MHLVQDLRRAFRRLRNSPGYTATVLLTLAIGIGLNAAIFTVVDAVLLRPLGYHDADRIVAIDTRFNAENRSIPRLGGDDYVDLSRDVHGLDRTGQYQFSEDGFALHGVSHYAPVASVGAAFSDIMGVQPIAGRAFRATDHNSREALLSAGFVRDNFASPAEAIGQTITYIGNAYTVVGVLPDGFSFPGHSQAWFQQPELPGDRTSYNNRVLARRSAGTSPAQLQAELATFSAQLQQSYPEDRTKSIEAVSLQEQIVGSVRPMLRLLMGAVTVLLLIVCANITHLLLVRSTRQAHGVSIRTALGASRASLASAVLAEVALLAVAGSALAVLLAVPTLKLLVRLAPPDLPRLADVHLNPHVLLFSALISVAVMVAASLLPVWRSWHVDPAHALRQDSSRGTESRSSLRLRSGFLIAEVALTLTLSLAAILLTQQLIAQSHQDLGFVPTNLLTLDTHSITAMPNPDLVYASRPITPETKTAYAADEAAYSTAALAHLDTVLQAAEATPGVSSVAAISGAPMGFGGSDVGYAIRGRTVFGQGAEKLPDASFLPISPGFLTTMGMPLIAGRNLTEADRAGAAPVTLINAELAQQQFPGQDPIGHQITCGFDNNSSLLTIVGVVGNIHADSPAAAPYPTFYAPLAQHGRVANDVQILVRTRANPAAIAESLRARLLRTHPEVAVKAATMTSNIATQQQGETFRTTLFALFAGVSVLLAAIGIYGVTAYTVAQRRFEFGLRSALGATRPQILLMVLQKTLITAAIGISVGVILTLALFRTATALVGKLPPIGLGATLLACAAILALATLATLLPAIRAATVQPATVLRNT